MSKEAAYLGHYLLEKTLGQGSYGKVKLATNTKTGQHVALKFIQKSDIKKPSHMQRIKREIRLLKLLNHSNIVQLYEVAETSHEIILTMEHAVGGELFDYIVARQKLSEKEARRLFRQIVSAVDYCHFHCIIHRDLKPENLLLNQDLDIKIIDFGFANTFEPNGITSTFCGSPFYASPEMVQGTKYVGPEVDIWSMGVILFALVCGYLPFDDSSMKSLYNKILAGKFVLPKHLSEEAADLISRIIVVDNKQRATMEDIKAHPWLNQGEGPPESFIPAFDTKAPVDLGLVQKIVGYGYEQAIVEEHVNSRISGPIFSMYRLLVAKIAKDKEAKQHVPVVKDEAEKKAVEPQISRQRRATMGGPNEDMQRAVAAAEPKPLPKKAESSVARPSATPIVKRDDNNQEPSPKEPEETAVSKSDPTQGKHGRRFSYNGEVQKVAEAFLSKFRSKKSEEVESKVREVKGIFNVATSSSKGVNDIVEEIKRVLAANDVRYTLKNLTFTCLDMESKPVEFELEICKIKGLNLHGIHLKRLRGDAWPYKKACNRLATQWNL